jgi:hypothetical protein
LAIQLSDRRIFEPQNRVRFHRSHRSDRKLAWLLSDLRSRDLDDDTVRRPNRSENLMVAISVRERIARLPIPEEQLVDGFARALYETHRSVPVPAWEGTSEPCREWVRAQARAGLAYLRNLERPAK